MRSLTLLRVAFVVSFLALSAGDLDAAPINVALNKPVTLTGQFGVLRPGSIWTVQPLGAGSVVNDGVFFPEGHLWNDGSVWWDTDVRESAANTIEIDLLGSYHITGLIAQGDNNDSYQIDYLDPNTNLWTGLGYFGPVSGWGLMTRPNGDQVTPLPISFTASKIRLTAFGGDNYFSYGEFQAFTDVPEPGAFLLVATGLAAAVLMRRRA